MEGPAGKSLLKGLVEWVFEGLPPAAWGLWFSPPPGSRCGRLALLESRAHGLSDPHSR